jgi:hypothetical protein
MDFFILHRHVKMDEGGMDGWMDGYIDRYIAMHI